MEHESTKTGLIPLILGVITSFVGDIKNIDIVLEIVVKCCSIVSFIVFAFLNYPRIIKRIKELKNENK